MTRFPRLDRRRFMATSAAALSVATGLVLPSRAAFAQAGRGGTLRVSVDQAPAKLNPLVMRTNPEYMLAESLYGALTRLAPDMTAEPDLAKSWSASDDLRTWTFVLREKVRFHDGSPLTSEDVVATLKAILDPETGSPARTNIGPIEAVDAKDERTVIIHTSGAYADLPVALAYTNAKILKASILAGDRAVLDHEANGAGPFKLVSYEPERQVVIERNPDYYDPSRPLVDRVEILVYPDPTAQGSAIIAGDTDLMLPVNPSEFERVSSAAGVAGLRTPSGQFLNVILGCDQPPFDDPRVRQALALTADREALVEFVAEGYGTVGNDTPINSAYRFYHDMASRTPNIDRAKSLLTEAGHGDGLDLTLIASDRPGTRTQLGVALREMAQPAGFRIEVQTMAHATYLEQVWRKGPFYVGFYNMQPTADAIFSLLYTSDAPWNETRWNNATFDGLISQARATADVDERRKLYAQAQELMHEEVPTVIPVFFDLLGAQREYVEGFFLHPRGAVFRLDNVWLGEGAPQRG